MHHRTADSVTHRSGAFNGQGELAEFDDTAFEYRRQVWVQIEAQRQAAGYKPGWSYYRFFDRFGVAPIVADGELVNPASATPEEKAEVYRELLRIAAQKGYKRGWAAYRFREAFGHWPRRAVA